MTNQQAALSQYRWNNMPIKPPSSTLFKVTVFRDMLCVVWEIGTGTSTGTTNILDEYPESKGRVVTAHTMKAYRGGDI
jgi:hypothetical protein